MVQSGSKFNNIPPALRILALLILLYTISNIGVVVYTFVDYLTTALSGGYSNIATSTLICEIIYLASAVLATGIAVVLFAQILINKRKDAAITIYMLYIALGTISVTYMMIYGIQIQLASFGVGIALLVILQIYLDPQLRDERVKERKNIEAEWKEEQEEGVIGFDETGKGAIEINFFNLFWIFIVCSIAGLIIEEIYHFIFVVPGEWQDRAGVLFGPFSPIYGVGAVLLTLMLNRLHKSNVVIVFVAAALIGGTFEALVGYFMEFSFGAVAWDYSNEVLPLFGGRTCLKFMIMWGFLGAAWLKLLMPAVVKFVNKIPWNWRYALTTVSAVLILVDAVMTLQALDCWYIRESNSKVESSVITQFYAEYFNDSYMENRFESMTIVPDTAIRG